MNAEKHLILASASPRRAELLLRLRLPFTVEAADIDETPLAQESAIEMTERLAFLKAQAIFKKLIQDKKKPAWQSSWVLGADTTVVVGGNIFGKPNSRQDAINMLSQLSGKTHEVISSISLLGVAYKKTQNIISEVKFGDINQKSIEAYCDTDEPYDKAGAYGIQGYGGAFVQHIKGDYSAIMGLPLWATRQLLLTAGFVAY